MIKAVERVEVFYDDPTPTVNVKKTTFLGMHLHNIKQKCLSTFIILLR